MNKFQLVLETTDPELFRKATCELGTLFYKVCNGNGHNGIDKPTSYEIVYFSGSRIARYNGIATDDLKRLCKASGFEVSEILFDESLGTLKIKQKNGLEA
jgi:hypothetical protein